MTNLTYKAPSMKDTKHSGSYGNAAIWDASIPVGGANGIVSTTGDSVVVDLMKLPAGTTVCDVSFVNVAYNTGAKIDVGFQYEDLNADIPSDSATPSTTAFISAQDVSISGSGFKPIKPLHFTIPAIVQVKFYGATGEQIKKTVSELYIKLAGISEGA